MRYSVIILCFIFFCIELQSQTISKTLNGQVSFVSSKNVYVKFKSTGGISLGDTLFIRLKEKTTPALIVNNLSSVSCVCTALAQVNLSVADLIIARIKADNSSGKQTIPDDTVKKINLPEASISTPEKPNSKGQTQKISGSISVNSYSDFSNTPAANSQRFRYSLSLNEHNIANSKFSYESYISFRHKSGDWAEIQNDIFNGLKIFNLFLSYDLDKTTKISLGRKINPRISNIGASDGLQIEKTINKFALGALAGTRPDYADYSFNFNLFQFGGYIALNTKASDKYSESSLAFMQQMNGSKLDRRFLYFQHSDSFIKNLYFLGTFEVDLYQLIIDSQGNETPENTFNPTGLYLSLRYKLTTKLTISGSYDARKNVMYYETYKTFTDRLLETELRQGFRIQANYRITRNLAAGLQSGYRFLKSDPLPSKNINGYLTYSQIPRLNISITLSGTYLESSYIYGKIYGANISRDIFKGKLQTSVGYHYVDYSLPENQINLIQNIGEMNIYWQFSKKMALSANYEGTFEKQDKYNRIYLQIRKRF